MEPTLRASDVDRMIKNEEKLFEDWLERLNKNGIGDITSLTALMKSSARHESLLSIRRGYLTLH
jgi:hypothetical protein